MKKLFALVLALLMMASATAALAEQPAVSPHDELVVGSTTALSGSFFTDMWGNNTSDIDVRLLLHGYNMMQWDAEMGSYNIDDSVVSGILVTDDAAGNRTYTITLYDDLVYSDGTRITAKDYAFSILLTASEEIAAIGGAVDQNDHIVGMADHLSGAAQTISGVRLLGDYRLAITVKAESLPFFYEMALLDYSPYPIHVIAPGCEVADDGEGVYIRNIDQTADPIFTAELLAKTILDAETGYLSHPGVVSGPYVLTAYDAQTGVAEFAINAYYKGNSAGQTPQIPKIIFKNVANEDMIEQLSSGEIDLINKAVNADAITEGMQLVAGGAHGMSNYARSGYSFISFNFERPAMQSAAVRQAVAMAFDKNAFVSSYVSNFGLAVDGYYGIGQWMYQLVEGTLPPPEDATDEELAAWEALSLENIALYDLDIEGAKALLENDGWILNSEGGEFNPEADAVRYKQIGDELIALELKLIYPEGNAISEHLDSTFVQYLAQIGVSLTTEARPFEDLLATYYSSDRDCDMIYLASNFENVFEPSSAFAVSGLNNRTGIADEKLYQLAVDMRQTEPGDVLTYCQKWVAFQEYYTEVLPAIPVYSNVYFDFYSTTLHDYAVEANVSWAQAIVGAYLGDVQTAE